MAAILAGSVSMCHRPQIQFGFLGYSETPGATNTIDADILYAEVDRMPQTESPDWDRIVERHAERVFRVALRILGSVQDAEDVSQDVFTEAFQLHSRGPVQSWTGLLVRLATLRSLDRLRRNRPTVELRECDSISNLDPFEEVAAAELADWMRKAVTQLPDQQATVFVMVHFERLSRDKVSAALGISPESVSTSLYKARQRLLVQLAVFNRGESK
jgi:RNA polymerase sigma-70 factor, ECF subfamily